MTGTVPSRSRAVRGWLRGRAKLPGRPRLLPITIGMIAVLFVVKLADLVQGSATSAALATASRVVVPTAQAAGPEAPKSETARPAVPNTAKDKPSAVPAPAPAAVSAEKAPAEKAPVDPGPSEAERALLLELRARRTALDERSAALEQREGLQAASDKQLKARLDQLGVLQARLEAMEQTRRERDEANWRSLVKSYETMRPRDAATIFNDIDQTVLLQVLDRMKEAKAGAILAAMQPERARVATTELAKWRTRSPTGTAP